MQLFSLTTFLGFTIQLSLVCSCLGTGGTTFAEIRSCVRSVYSLGFVYASNRRGPRPSRSPRFLLLGRIDMLFSA